MGSGTKGYAPLQSLYELILTQLEAGKSNVEIEETIREDGHFPYLVFETGKGTVSAKAFSQSTKSAVALKTLLAAAPRCAFAVLIPCQKLQLRS